jgi:hypothetical protein
LRTRTSILEDKKEKELENLLENRRKRFKEIFPNDWLEKDIEALARSSVHPTEVDKMIKEGCSYDLIAKILI